MKDFKYYIIGASALLLIYVTVLYNKPQPANWEATLKQADKIPFGTYVLYNQLTSLFPDAKVIKTNQSVYTLFKKGLAPGNYLIITKSANLSSVDMDEMIRFIKAGNNVFISALNWSSNVRSRLKINIRSSATRDSGFINFVNPTLKQAKPYRFDKGMALQYFNRFDTLNATVISMNAKGKANYLRYTYGKGNLLIGANPLLFTNYSLLNQQGAQYAERALSYLPNVKTVYWDQYQNGDIGTDMSPMRVFFANSALQWAYYLSLFSIVIFVLYEVKRRQRVIPVIAPLQNTTLDFVKVVGKVYYDKRDNANIAYKRILYWLSYLREQHQLKTNLLNDEFIDHVTHKTSSDRRLISELVEHINYLDKQDRVTDNELIILNQLIEKFYSQS